MTKIIPFDINLECTSRIYIYGAGIFGRIAYNGLRNAGFYPTAFIDKEITEQAIPVIKIDDVEEIENAVFLICALQYFGDIYRELSKRGAKKIFSIENLIYNCKYEELDHTFDLENKEIDLHRYSFYKDIFQKTVFSKEYLLPELMIVTNFNCNLRCKHCLSWQTELINKPSYNIELIIKNLLFFLDAFDISKIILIGGGEFFLYPQYKQLIEYIEDLDKISNIDIVTNGTIIPEVNLFTDKVRLIIDDYSDSIGNISKVKDIILKYKRQKTVVHKYSYWNDVTKFKFRSQNDDINKLKFSRCHASHCFALIGDDFVRCVHAYLCEKNLHKSISLPYNLKTKSYVSIKKCSVSELRERVKNLCEVDMISACAYCPGTNSANKIKPAIQKKEN